MAATFVTGLFRRLRRNRRQRRKLLIRYVGLSFSSLEYLLDKNERSQALQLCVHQTISETVTIEGRIDKSAIRLVEIFPGIETPALVSISDYRSIRVGLKGIFEGDKIIGPIGYISRQSSQVE